MLSKKRFCLWSIVLIFLYCIPGSKSAECNLTDALIQEIASYEPIVQAIIDSVTLGPFTNKTYNELVLFIDKFGPRKIATPNLENSIDYLMELSTIYGLENVHGETIRVPNWVRGEESATLVQPRQQNLNMLGLGNSIGTPPEGILGQVLVVRSFEELQERASEAVGKIVVFNQEFISYGVSGQYRGRGAVEVAKVGGIATLIRSVTPFSMNTPHTGMMQYEVNVTQIPAACITVEDAKMLQRMQDRGENIAIFINMQDQILPDETSRNTFIEIQGSVDPNQYVLLTNHIDSWDVGMGAMDDGGGVFITWGALALLKSLDLRPRRTMRGIFWTAEEFGLLGSSSYKKAHFREFENYTFILDSDSGTFTPLGIQFNAPPEGECILREIMNMFVRINTTEMIYASGLVFWTGPDVPGASLYTMNEEYFWYHHTGADTMELENPDSLNKATALWASLGYILADLSVEFPRPPPS